jgi:hypothetical protein
MKEGVTLNIIDEINKLKKYMYGINEIIFYKFNEFLSKGIFTHIFGNFLFSEKINIYVKYAILSYICSYYTILLSPFIYLVYIIFELTLSNAINYQILILDQNYIILTSIIIFYILSLISNIVFKIKHVHNQSIKKIIYDEIIYGLYLSCFMGGLPLHFVIISYKYFFDKKISWDTTNKEFNKLNIMLFILNYKYLYIFFSLLLLLSFGIIYFLDKIKIIIIFLPLYISIFYHVIFPFFTF